jgi:beta-galactosidase
MKKIVTLSVSILIFVFLLFGISCSRQTSEILDSRTTSFDEGWRYLKDSTIEAWNPDYDDSGWRILDVPHDWGIEDLPGQNGVDIIGPFDKSSVDKMSSGYLTGGIAWYRKTFSTDPSAVEKITYLQFDGVYMNTDVWLNGRHLGFHPYGYTPFFYDITSFLNPPGEKNTVAVRVRNEGLSSRWYSGSGINRHVWLTQVNPVHIEVSGGLYVTTPRVSEASAEVNITVSLVNLGTVEKEIVLQAELSGPSGKPAGQTSDRAILAPGRKVEVIQKVVVENPVLWSVENLALYQAQISVLDADVVIDREKTPFGFRTVSMDARNGMAINGKPIKMIGGCYHHDNGPLGAASIDRAEERKIEILKNAGFNAIRTSHNPPSPALLDACDRLGMLVINEIFDMWEYPKKEQDYHQYFREWWQKDVESWVKRDRNHPSVIMWSIGNEIHETFDTTGLRIATQLTGEIRRLDPTRAITEAFNDFAARRGLPSKWHEIPEHMDLLDVVGYNYMYTRYEEDHERYPDRVMVGTETNPPLALENYEIMMKNPYVIGYFVWTATDNIGEAGVGLPQLRDINQDNTRASMVSSAGSAIAGTLNPGQANAPGPAGMPGGGFFRRDTWPVFTNYQGDIDLIGNRKVPSYYQHVVWGKSMVEMFVHRPIPEGKTEITSRWGFPDAVRSWNWKGNEGDTFQVLVYTRSRHVKLELNGRVVGAQDIDQAVSITAAFDVPYEPGTLVARCFDDGRETATQALKTTGEPVAVKLVADRTRIRANRNDLSYVMAEIIDTEGNIVPDADDVMVRFEVSGSGIVAGVGNGDPRDMSSFQQPLKKTWEGRCLAIIRPEKTPGNIRLKASAPGLKDGILEIKAL